LTYIKYPECLISITTDQIASQEVQDSMKNIPDKGKLIFDDFVQKKLKEFLRPIKEVHSINLPRYKKTSLKWQRSKVSN